MVRASRPSFETVRKCGPPQDEVGGFGGGDDLSSYVYILPCAAARTEQATCQYVATNTTKTTNFILRRERKRASKEGSGTARAYRSSFHDEVVAGLNRCLTV